MLVKFLSLTASAFMRTARHKGILVSGLLLAMILGGIGAMALNNANTHDAASTAAPQPSTQQQSPAWLNSQQQAAQSVEPATDQPATDQQPANNSVPANSDTPTAPPANTSEVPEIIISSSKVALVAGEAFADITARTTDDQLVSWTATIENNPPGLTLALPVEPRADATIRLKADAQTPPGTYRVVLAAKDSARGVQLTKNITVTVK